MGLHGDGVACVGADTVVAPNSLCPQEAAPSGQRTGLLDAIQNHGGVSALSEGKDRPDAAAVQATLRDEQEKSMAAALSRALGARRGAVYESESESEDDDWGV